MTHPSAPQSLLDGMSVSRPHAPASAAGNDAPLIAERAATRGRSETEGGDEQAGVKRRYPFASRTLSPRHVPQ
jgi:hypothetical protein